MKTATKQAALKTLQRLGYTYNGGELWKPPLGPVPDYIKKEPNVIFGVLTNGEIFVEVNGQQHTPADAFYKMATIQSTKLAHQVRDLEFSLEQRTDQLKATAKKLNELESKFEITVNDIAQSLENWRPII
jgi:hypothetical protein